MMGSMSSLLLCLFMIDPTVAYSRYDVGGKTPPMTCGGGIMNAQTIKTIKGENPNVPVSIIARYPLLDHFVKGLSGGAAGSNC